MPAVVKKQKQKAAKKQSPAKSPKKFVSESLQNRKPRKGAQKKTPKHKKRGVVYIKHLPHGFYEDQLRGFFSQFGEITRLRLARSTKTLNSKGYAFIEFRYPEVAEIAADSMNNYLMFKNIIKTRYIQPSDIRHDYFRSSVKKVVKDGVKVLTSKTVEAREAVVKATNKLMTEDDEIHRTEKIGKKIQKTKKKLEALGIEFNVDEIAQNMGEEVMEAAEKAKATTIADIDENELSDEADETFDPENVDIDSDDEFDDFEYASEHSDEDEDDIDETIGNEKLDNAIKVAREASKKAVEEQKNVVDKKVKRKGAEEAEKSSKKTRSAAEPEVKVVEEVKAAPAKKGKKKSPVVKEPVEEQEEEAAPAPKAKRGKKPAEEKPAPVAAPKPTKQKKTPEPVEAPAEKAKKGKKEKKTPAPVEPQTKRPTRTVAAPPESPAPAPVKTKKLAKSSTTIEKKKPAKADKKLKVAAKVADVEEIVKVVKGKEIKGKKKAAKK